MINVLHPYKSLTECNFLEIHIVICCSLKEFKHLMSLKTFHFD